MLPESINLPWNINKVNKDLQEAFKENSEEKLSPILKGNSFLFYELFSRKGGIQPIFHEISFGGNLRCDFAWLNDNSDGPEWVLLEIERPRLRIFKNNGEKTQDFNHAIEQVESWKRYFNEFPHEKRRIFGAVARFRFILIAGDEETWSNEDASKWRIDHNNSSQIEIRSSDLFFRAIETLKNYPEEFWSFSDKPKTLPPKELDSYLKSYNYIEKWRKILPH